MPLISLFHREFFYFAPRNSSLRKYDTQRRKLSPVKFTAGLVFARFLQLYFKKLSLTIVKMDEANGEFSSLQ